MDHLWTIYALGPHQDQLRTIYGPFMLFLDLAFMDRLWTIYGPIYGPFMDQLWTIYGPFMDHLWTK